MKTIQYIFLIGMIMVGLFASCDQPGLELNIQPKKIYVEESTIYVDGFLAKGTPAHQGSENDPADKIGIPFVNGFGRTMTVEFLDQSAEYGFSILGGEVTLAFQGDKQYVYFSISGTPSKSGLIPIAFNVYENGKQIGQTSIKPIRVWNEGTTRPPRDLIPTDERPLIFIGAELNWVNQTPPTATATAKQVFWTAMKSHPSTSITVAGTTYGCVVNLRYNSIIIANNAIRPENVGGNTGSITVFAPTAENLEQYPEAFRLKDGSLSHTWSPQNVFFHGTNSKPITVGMWDTNTPDLVVSGNRARPLSSLSWNINSTRPYGCLFAEGGTYKLYVKYINTDNGNDIVQYFPKHPVTGESGWVPYEFTIADNPVPGFVVDAQPFNPDWMPTAEQPVKAIRGELVLDNQPKTMTANQAVGNSYAYIRLWFATYKGTDVTPKTYSFKAKADAGWTSGFENVAVEAIGGAGSLFGAGTAAKNTNESIHFFLDNTLNDQYFVSYADFWLNPSSKIVNSGTYSFNFNGVPGTGTSVIPYNITCPVTVTVVP